MTTTDLIDKVSFGNCLDLMPKIEDILLSLN